MGTVRHILPERKSSSITDSLAWYVNVTDGVDDVLVSAAGAMHVHIASGAAGVNDTAITSFPTQSASGSFTTVEDEVKITLAGEANTTFQITGTWAGVISFEASNDNSNWVAIWGYQSGTTTITTGTTVNGIFRCTTSGFKYVRARYSTDTSGTAVVTAHTSHGTSGVFINFPQYGAQMLGKQEDVAHATGDTGVFVQGVRNDTPNAALTSDDLDYSAVALYKTGSVRPALLEDDFAVLGSSHVKKYYTNAGAVTDGIVWSPASGKRWYVTDIFINVSAAATVTLEDDLGAGDSPVWKAELAANSGWSHHFGTPLFSGEDAADLLITTSAGNVYVCITGYEI